MATFQERINQLYEEAKDANYRLTQIDYAAQLGATRNQLKGWLDGRGEPNTEMLKTIANKHRVSVSWLVGETNNRSFIEGPNTQQGGIQINDLPLKAVHSIKEYIELIRIKYQQKPADK